MKSREELVQRAIEKLKVVGAGQTASAAVVERVDKLVDPVMSSLAVRGVFAWGDDDELPEEAFEHLADCLSFAAAPDFGKDYGDPRIFEQRLRELNTYALSGQAQRVDYY